jgi:hypothetical protein
MGPILTPGHAAAIGPIGLSADELMAEAKAIETPIYWAGPVDGDSYELTRTTQGYLYIRYLPHGTPVGATGSKFLIVATYPRTGASGALKDWQKEKTGSGTIAGPDGSIVFVDPSDAKTVVVAFPNVDYEIEIYAPGHGQALAIAESGKIRPVG